MTSAKLSEDPFKDTFKFYKKKTESLDLSQVINFDHIDRFQDKLAEVELQFDEHILRSQFSGVIDSLVPLENIKVYTLRNSVAGLYVVPRIFKPNASTLWFQKLLNEIPVVFADQLRSNIKLPPNSVESAKLRWVTFGYHHNWDTKEYNPCDVGIIPPEIANLSNCLASLLNLNTFKPEAGIINYYTRNSSLSPHCDFSELNQRAPLLSLSFGCPAIFLVGGKTRDSLPIFALQLNDSDLLIMSEEARSSFHAVPKILDDTYDVKKPKNDAKCTEIMRINVNIRQVY